VHESPARDRTKLAPVAQWIERRPPEPKVAGSNPVRRASLFAAGGIIGAVPPPPPVMRIRGNPVRSA
jgi:hypothetical protein